MRRIRDKSKPKYHKLIRREKEIKRKEKKKPNHSVCPSSKHKRWMERNEFKAYLNPCHFPPPVWKSLVRNGIGVTKKAQATRQFAY